MQSIFNVTSIYGEYTNKKITILTNFTVNPETVNKKNVNVVDASSGTVVIYKLSVDDNKIIITLKEWPNLESFYQINVKDIKDMLGRELTNNITKDIKFSADSKYKAVITSPVNNEAVLTEHNLFYFSINRINEDGTITVKPNTELKDIISLPTYNSKLRDSNMKEAILESESGIQYEFQFASDVAFFDIVQSYISKFTDGLIQLDNGQYYMRARVKEKEDMDGDWSDTITFSVVPNGKDCENNILTEAEKDYLEEVLAPVEFFLEDETELKIVSRSQNGETYPEFYIEFNLDIDASKLPEKIIAYRSDF